MCCTFWPFSNCERLDILVNKEPASKRHHSKIRVDQLKYDIQQIQSSLNGVLVKQREWERRERERDELLQTRLVQNRIINSYVGILNYMHIFFEETVYAIESLTNFFNFQIHNKLCCRCFFSAWIWDIDSDRQSFGAQRRFKRKK